MECLNHSGVQATEEVVSTVAQALSGRAQPAVRSRAIVDVGDPLVAAHARKVAHQISVAFSREIRGQTLWGDRSTYRNLTVLSPY
jgi:hypothetical protein